MYLNMGMFSSRRVGWGGDWKRMFQIYGGPFDSEVHCQVKEMPKKKEDRRGTDYHRFTAIGRSRVAAKY